MKKKHLLLKYFRRRLLLNTENNRKQINNELMYVWFQDYDAIRKTCKASGNLFEDQEFPAQDKSLFYSSGKLTGVDWKRPKVSTVMLYINGRKGTACKICWKKEVERILLIIPC